MKTRFALLIFAGLLAIFACQKNEKVTASGEALAKIYCVSCHQYPEPALLDKATWRDYVLPRMGYLMGIYDQTNPREALLEQGAAAELLAKANVFPENPTIDTAILNKIAAFYINRAPERLELPAYPKPAIGLSNFRVQIPNYRLSPPSTTLVQIRRDGGLYLGDANTKALYLFDKKLALQKAANLKEAPVWLQEIRNIQFVTAMGSFSPTDAPSGTMYLINDALQIVLPALQRPVHSEIADLNEDKKADILVCEFAKWTGCLAWWENQGNAQYVKHILRNKPGAIKAYVRDFNQDKKLDVIALFGQGDEGIFIFYNQGNGQFQEQKIIAFPPSYGSSYFNLVDFNQDGYEDIIYTAGDNADYPPLLKPYHGIRIFFNNGKNEFEEKFFFPLHGAYNAIAEDFDQDGDMDIAAISFFPDYQNAPAQSFCYLENQGNNEFKALTLPEATKGRWIVMDAGDIDLDGDTDLVLGSLAFEIVPENPILDQWIREGIGFMILENTLK